MYKITLESLVLEAVDSIQKGYKNKVMVIYRWGRPKELLSKLYDYRIPYCAVNDNQLNKETPNDYYTIDLREIRITEDAVTSVIYEPLRRKYAV